MGFPLTRGGAPIAPHLPSLTARARPAEADTPQTVAAERFVVDTEGDTSYGDAVQSEEIVDGLSGGRKDATALHRVSPSRTTAAAEPVATLRLQPLLRPAMEAEAQRQGRLSRWQEVRP